MDPIEAISHTGHGRVVRFTKETTKRAGRDLEIAGGGGDIQPLRPGRQLGGSYRFGSLLHY